MQIGITVELMSPRGSVAFQSQVGVQEESIRHTRKELQPDQLWQWRLAIPRDRVAVFAAQSMAPCRVSFNGSTEFIELLGQGSTDFGLIYAYRDGEEFGAMPFDGDLAEITVVNIADKMNRIDIFVAEKPES